MDMIWLEWPVGGFSSLEAMSMKPSPARRLSVAGFPDQKRVYPALCSYRLPSSGEQTSLRAAMSTSLPGQFVRNQSRATFRSIAVSFVKHDSDVPACQF